MSVGMGRKKVEEVLATMKDILPQMSLATQRQPNISSIVKGGLEQLGNSLNVM